MAMDLRRAIRDSDKGPLRVLKGIHRTITRASVPAPPAVWRPIWRATQAARHLRDRAWSGLLVTPMFHGVCRTIGDDFAAGSFLPFVTGYGDIHLGDHVTVYGKLDVHFGSSGSGKPSLHVGDHVVLGHGASFSVSEAIRIGDRTLLAPNVTISDCNGHPIDPERRRRGEPPATEDVRPVTIGENVWIGAGAIILPGTTIGDDCIVGAGARVSGDVPPAHMVVPAEPELRKIRRQVAPLNGRPRRGAEARDASQGAG